ncbi:hypothetical protein PTTG_06284 [Puccinia triticina 1-1 BBBD Race 1]|uniref:Uncharacterized protein n=2 Tax=Puccinia triticina TaxID=208348 RepID=A0A180GRZ2_PUCT1|nr:uncharacterized protein PtA15_7A616 [Puccinia triticina]OAV95596.1 hypothetical protein PTTG_06284 [Puccinia triticina 1-1 BBBD Race 1]WAQ86887.1 hypothetical protein PtA15_7A616 [Puccinia triticina]
MSIFRLLGFSARHQRSNEDSSSLNCGRWDSYKTDPLSENPERLAAVWLETSECKPRLPISSAASTVGSSVRHQDISSQSSRSQRGPGQSRNFSNLSLPVIQRKGLVKLKEVAKHTRREDSADDSPRALEPLTPSKLIRIPLRYPRAKLTAPPSSQPHEQRSGGRARSLSCLKPIRDLNHNQETDENSEMLSAACFLPKLSMESSVLSCITTLGGKQVPDDNAKTCCPEACSSPAATSSYAGYHSPSTRRPHSERAQFPQTYTLPYPAGFRTSQPSPSEYHYPATAQEDEIIQDPCYPKESDDLESVHGFRFPSAGRPEMGSATHSSPRPLTSHSSSGSHFSFTSICRSPEVFSSQTLSSSRPASEPQRHMFETQTNQMNTHRQSHVRSLTKQEHLESLSSTKHASPSMSWSSAKLSSFPSFGQQSRSGNNSIASTSDERCRAIHFVGIEKPFKIEATMQPLSPYQRDMLDIMAVHGESLFKSPVSTELTIEKDPSHSKEPSEYPSTRSSIEMTLKDKILSKASQRSRSSTLEHVQRDGLLQSDVHVRSAETVTNANRRLANQAEKAGSESPLRPVFKPVASPPRETRFKKAGTSSRPSTAVPTTRATEFVRRLSQSSKNKPFAEQRDPDIIASKQDKFEALLKASDASKGGTLKLTLSSKIDSLDEAPNAPPTFLPHLRLSCDFFSLRPRHLSDCETEVVVDSKQDSK